MISVQLHWCRSVPVSCPTFLSSCPLFSVVRLEPFTPDFRCQEGACSRNGTGIGEEVVVGALPLQPFNYPPIPTPSWHGPSPEMPGGIPGPS